MLLNKVIKHFDFGSLITTFVCNSNLNVFLDLDQIALSGLDKQGMCRDLEKPCVREFENSFGRGKDI